MESTARPFVLDNTLGAAFVGMVVAATLHGVSCVQTLYYFTHQTDRWPTKLLVGSVMFFDTVHQALITHTVYTYVVTDWGNPRMLDNLVWSLLVEVLFNGLTALLVQSFLTMRVWKSNEQSELSSHRARGASREQPQITPSMINRSLKSLLVVAEFVCVLVFTAVSMRLETFTKLANLEILFSVNTGFLTSLCAVASLISITVAGHTFLYIAFFFCIGRLYTNSLLATLNARKMIRGSADGIHTTSENISLHKYGGGASRVSPSFVSPSRHHATNISIKIDTTKEFATDSDPDMEAMNEKSMRMSINDMPSLARNDTIPHHYTTEKEPGVVSI
ncbi:hypothetical protein CC1G_10442 [Coprinopsis cinerea okayama7|uniref:DUF6534 domain-containing protein n=1 Tax=Coprinopsis cinerea (strain Okayama-7 / 130 / ATCC MYA-4618 / FGSC 9003) TaxID=240176 RepID=A8PDS5_COPC7|nr:hypothetical protein CC1G_10442 [Coprinopsis cinerea okayama7\|eukprot:XP_001840656.2 hypothetical protein CC1G_10442 [Coprinopsis cinerea okayama7\